jgi:hypothetical protein
VRHLNVILVFLPACAGSSVARRIVSEIPTKIPQVALGSSGIQQNELCSA